LKRFIACLLIPVFLFVNCVYTLPVNAETEQASAQLSKANVPEPVIKRNGKIDKQYLKENRKKISSELLALIDDTLLPDGETKEQLINQIKNREALVTPGEANSKGLVPVSDNLVYVYISLNDGSNVNALKPFVNKITNQSEQNNLVVAWVEIGKIESLSKLTEVYSIDIVQPPVFHSGSILSEGDNILGAGSFRNLSGINGTGIKVGIISDGMDSWTASRDMGDLPSNVVVLRNARGGDEGTAMAEIVYDLAPGAQIYFHDVGFNTLEFIDAVQSLADAGCNIIVDDVGWIEEPFFEDGLIAGNLKSILAINNIVYFSAAGNSAEQHYQGNFRDDSYGYHDFDSNSGPTLLPVLIPAQGSITTVLQWNDKFGSSGNDYDLYLYDQYGTVLGYSKNYQDGSGDPIEEIIWSNNSSYNVVGYIDIQKYEGAAKKLELYVYDSAVLDYGTSADSIFGHPALPEVISVGAIDAASPSQIEEYSSRGPVTISYPTAQLRNKPDVCGIDGVLVTGVGGFSSRFYGTSAAAPHIAALAALVWAQSPTKNASEISGLIKKGCVDLGAAGYDNIYGYGRENIFLATFPSVPVGLTATSEDKGVVVSWSPNEESDLNGYQLEYRTGTAAWTIKAQASTVTSYAINYLTNGLEYQIRLKAKDAAGNWSGYTETKGVPRDSMAAPIPAGLKVTSVNDKQVVLGWTAVSAADLAGYQIAFQEAGAETWTEVGPIGKVTTYTITGLENEKSYNFKIRSLDTSGNLSNYASSITGIPVDKMPPSIPSELTVIAGENRDINIKWKANTEEDFSNYDLVYLKYGTTTLSTVPLETGMTSASVEGLTYNTRYGFKIRARDLKGNWSNYSGIVYATARDLVEPSVPEITGVVTKDRSLQVNWTENPEDDLNGYQLEYRTGTAAWTIKAQAGTVTSYAINYLTNELEYQIRLKAKDAAGNWSGYSDVIIATPHSL